MRHIGVFLLSEAATNAVLGNDGPVRENLVATMDIVTKPDIPQITPQQYVNIAQIASVMQSALRILDRHPGSMDETDLRILANTIDRLETDGFLSHNTSGFEPEIAEKLRWLDNGVGVYTPQGLLEYFEYSAPELFERGLTADAIRNHMDAHLPEARIKELIRRLDTGLVRLTDAPWEGSYERLWEDALGRDDPNPELTRELLGIINEGTSKKLFTSYIVLRTQAAATRVVIAIHRYRLRHDEFPASLDDLDDDLLPVIPTDPMSGAPIRYLLTEDGPVVYSTGADRDDDGGRHPLDRYESRTSRTIYWTDRSEINSEIERDSNFDGDYVIYPPEIDDW